MSESNNIAAMADKISMEIFSVFGWQRVGPKDTNWPCVLEGHGKKTHPSDVVFWYDEPYRDERIYVNVDLKSYSALKIEKSDLAAAARSLAMATECANQSEEWQKRFVNDGMNRSVAGMLFIYNHDAEYDGDFQRKIDNVDGKAFSLASGLRMFIVGPSEISYLRTVSNDISVMRGLEQMPKASECKFYYPDLVEVRARSNSLGAATLEMLTGPWQTLRYRNEKDGSSWDEVLIYYRGDGNSTDEFMYLIDYLFRFQLLEENTRIRLRLPNGKQEAPVIFERAAEKYADHFAISRDIKKRLTQIRCEVVSSIITKFSELELGMRREG
ncbi:hypothetical protein [Myxococcus sp. Y35]|uniref:hypothetical protein n=1 Tax=Pseudomyxococcus flavus TaxID=3115648 RepID=UPI003CF427AC